MKTCRKCERSLPEGEFYSNGGRSRRTRPYCKGCDIAAGRLRYQRLKAINPTLWRLKIRQSAVKSKYGLTLSQCEALLKGQSGKCAICRRGLERFASAGAHVDHCHRTGKVRGVLCHTCNKALGYFKDDPALLGRAIRYLQAPAMATLGYRRFYANGTTESDNEFAKEQLAAAGDPCQRLLFMDARHGVVSDTLLYLTKRRPNLRR